MTLIDTKSWELQNIVRRSDGLRTREGLVSILAAPSDRAFVGGFSMKSPTTTEIWHYLFQQNTITTVVTLRVMTEEMIELYTFELGPMQLDPVISVSMTNRQLLINSPSFSTPYYGIVGGGIINAVKVPSAVTDFTALDLQVGHVCSFGDRPVIAAGATLFFGDGGIDPRTFVVENQVPIPGSVFDIFQAGDGTLQIFTSDGVYTLAADALGQGQIISGFLAKVPGLMTSKSRNAAFSNGITAVLQRDSIVTIAGEKLWVASARTRRFFSRVVEVEDLRQQGEIFPTRRGFLVGFRSSRGFFIDIDIIEKSISYAWSSAVAMNLTGVLEGRDGNILPLCSDRVRMSIGNLDFGSATVQGVMSGRIPIPAGKNPVVRRITTSTENAGETAQAYLDGTSSSKTVPVFAADTAFSANTWSASVLLAGRDARTVRHSFASRIDDPSVEVGMTGGDRRLEAEVDLMVTGQAPNRADKQ